MQVGNYEIQLEKRIDMSPQRAAGISVLAVLFALVLFGGVFLLDNVSPLRGYWEIFSYGFLNPRGLVPTFSRFIFLLLCTIAFILPFRAGLWNIGMTGQLYMGSLGAFGVVLAFGGRIPGTTEMSPWIFIPLMMVAAALAGGIWGGIAGFLKGKWEVNEIVVTMIMNFIAFWLVSEFIKEGGALMNPGGRGESFQLPQSLQPPVFMGMPFTVLIALLLAVLAYVLLTRTQLGFQIRAFGSNPSAARYAGISPLKISLLVFVLGGAVAGLAGYHIFGAAPGVYKIARNYGDFGNLAFYGIICGLIALGSPLASIPVALLFGGLSNGGRYAQGKLHLRFGVDLAMLGVLMIVLVGFQFFYQYRITINKRERELDVGIPD
ncbi:MAG: ABC transporter permease [Anaerolineales bacterium]|nr:ABC transporter permease [Anaerolineales bacterium]